MSSNTSTVIPTLLVKEIQDLFIRQNFQRLFDYFNTQNQFLNFKFFEINETGAITTAKTITHNLGVIPRDVVVTQVSGSGAISFLYGKFTTRSLSYTTTGPVRVRFFVGNYFLDSSSVNAQETDSQTFLATPVYPGSIFLYAGATLPEGYLACDGSLVNRILYATLFLAIGTRFGVGDSLTTFRLPQITPPAGDTQYMIKT